MGNLLESIFIIHKQKGETLADLLVRFRKEQKLSDDIKITYAGRLDPMASGVVPLLVGDARFRKEEYIVKDKVYELEILFGVETDTLDMLGLITNTALSKKLERGQVEKVLFEISEIKTLPYPEYSSKTVSGVPLFVYARKGEEIEIPKKEVVIQKPEIISIEEKNISELVRESIEIIKKVQGDFRQEEIIAGWESFLQKYSEVKVWTARIQVQVSSGTYMRSLAKWIGERLEVPSLAYDIVRVKVL